MHTMELFSFMSDMTKAQRDVIVLEAQCSGDRISHENDVRPCNSDSLKCPLQRDLGKTR